MQIVVSFGAAKVLANDGGEVGLWREKPTIEFDDKTPNSSKVLSRGERTSTNKQAIR